MNFKRVFFNFLFLSLISYTTLSIFYSAVSFNWTFQDWNINYDGGFVRRGLGGEFFSFIKNLFMGKTYNFILVFPLILHIFIFKFNKFNFLCASFKFF